MPGIGVHDAWNRCSGWNGIRVHDGPEYAVGDSGTSKPANEVTTDSGAGNRVLDGLTIPPVPRSLSSAEPCREIIEPALMRGRNAMAIWQDLVSDHGFGGSYEAVKRFVRKLRGVTGPAAAGIIQTGPGEEAQVDYGTGPMVRDPKTGKYRRTRLFVMTLGYSRKSVRLLRFKSSSRIWAELCWNDGANKPGSGILTRPWTPSTLLSTRR